MSMDKKTTVSADSIVKDIHESLLSNINHALRTPLNGLVGMSDLLAKSGLNNDQLKYTDIIRESTELLLIQLNNIMELAKIDEGQASIVESTCYIKDLVKDAIKPLISIAVKHEIPLSVHFDSKLPHTVCLDVNKVRQIITNLVSCALKFAEHGKIVLNVSYINDDEDPTFTPQIEFSINNSKVLFDAFTNALEHYNTQQKVDIRSFGEIAVSLITVQQLLELMGSHICFEHLSTSEPPFKFALDLNHQNQVKEIDPSPYDDLTHVRLLIFQKNPLEMNLMTQSLQLWEIDYTIVTENDKLRDEVINGAKAGRPYDIVIFEDFDTDLHLSDIKAKVKHLILNCRLAQITPAIKQEFSALLTPPIYPEELLSTLFSLYKIDHETSITSEASQHVRTGSYDALNAKVLIVEDDLVSRIYATELIEGFGCKVTAAENGRQALNMLDYNDDYDLIFMDCMMPHVNGYEATQEIRNSAHKNIPIIALTANTLEQDKEKCLASGMDDYITKPVKEQDLYNTLTKHLK